MTFPFPLFVPAAAVGAPPVLNLWGWWDAQHSYTETTGTPTTLITVDGTLIGSHIDRSGNNRHMYQLGKPTFKTGIQNSLAAALCSGAQGMATTGVSAPVLPNTVYIVLKPTGWANNAPLVAWDVASAAFFLGQSGVTPNIALSNNGIFGTQVPVSLNNSHLVAASISASAALAIRVDAGSDVANSLTVGGSGGQVLCYGNFLNSLFYTGYVMELLVYNGPVHSFGSGDGLLVRQYLNNKYNLGLGI